MKTLNLPDELHAHLVAYCKKYGLLIGSFAVRTLAIAMQNPPDFGVPADAGEEEEEESECSECETSASSA